MPHVQNAASDAAPLQTETRLTLSIAGFAFAIELARPELAAPLLEQYGPFIQRGPTTQTPDVTIYLEHQVDQERTENWTPEHTMPSLEHLGITSPTMASRLNLYRDEAYGFTMDVPYLYGQYDGHQRSELTIYTERLARGFEQFIVSLCINVMLPKRCIILHASGVLHDGKALLFSGPSNAGKTTVVENSPDRTILSDELVAVSYNPETDALWAHGTPFYGSWNQLGEPVSAPLHGIHFLRKDKEHALEALSFGERFQRACQVICSIRPNNTMMTEQFLSWADRLTPYCRLFGFVPNPSLWDYLTQPQNTWHGLG